MSRPFIKFVQCDGCGLRKEHADGGPSQWIPESWSELFVRLGPGDETKHFCLSCTSRLLKQIDRLQMESFAMRMHNEGPPGFEPCTRPDWPHDGPCAHERKR